MKKLLLVVLLLIGQSFLFAGGGWADGAIKVKTNGGSVYNYKVGGQGWTDGTWELNTDFDVHAFGTVTSLVLDGAAGDGWTDDVPGYNATSFTLYYRVYLSSGAAGAWNSLALDNLSYTAGNNRIYDKTGANIDLITLAGGADGTYTFEVVISKNQFFAGGNWLSMIPGGQVVAYNSATAGYKATFVLNSALPVELTSLSAIAKGTNVTINWNTATEQNNQGFSIERKSANSDWAKVGFVKGAGSSNSQKSYSFVDATSLTGKIEYRLKQIDKDGNYKYSQVVEVNIETPKEFALYQNYPNPFNPSTTIKYQIPVDGFVSLKVYNLVGDEVATLVSGNKSAGTYEAKFEAGKLSSGVYLYTLQSGSFSKTSKLVVMK